MFALLEKKRGEKEESLLQKRSGLTSALVAALYFPRAQRLGAELYSKHCSLCRDTQGKVLSPYDYNLLLTKGLSCSESPAQIIGVKCLKICPRALNPVSGLFMNEAKPFSEGKLGKSSPPTLYE